MPYKATIEQPRYFGGTRSKSIESVSIYSLVCDVKAKIDRLRHRIYCQGSIFVVILMAIQVLWDVNISDDLITHGFAVLITLVICSPLIRWSMMTYDRMEAWKCEHERIKEQISFLTTLSHENLLLTPPLFRVDPRIYPI